MILLAEFYFNGGYTVERVATDFYYSKSTDSIGVKEFSGKITGRPTLKSKIGCKISGDKSSTSIGDIELANTDGAISGWVDYDFRDCRCVLKLVRQNASYDTAVTVQVCIIDDVQRDELKVVVKLRGNETMLQRAIQPFLYTEDYAGSSIAVITPVISAAEGDFDTDISDWTLVTNTDGGGTATGAWSSGTALLEVDGAGAALPWPYVDFSFPSTLVAGRSYTYSLDVDVTISTIYQGRVQVQFRPDSLAPADYVQLLVVSNTGTHSISGTFVAPVAGKLFIRVGAVAAESASAVIDNVRLNGITYQYDSSLVQNTIPIVIGKTLQMEPVTTDAILLAYQISDSLMTVDTVYSGGSIASGPFDSPDDYAVSDTGFTMLTNPSARITADASARVVPVTYVDSDFYLDSAWSGATPVDWVVNEGLETLSHETDVGLRLVNTDTGNYPQIDTTLAAGNWYIVVGEVCDLVTGGIVVDFGGSIQREFKRQGRFYCVGKTDTSGKISIRALSTSDVTLRFVHVIGLDSPEGDEWRYDYNVLKVAFARAGMRISGIDTSIGSNYGYSVGVAITESETCEDVIQSILDSMSAYTYTDNLGTIRIGRYERPSGTPVATISRLNMTRYPKRITDAATGLSTRFAGAKNWSPYAENELAGITYPNRPPFMVEYRHVKTGVTAPTINRAYTHALSAAPIETVLTEEADIQAEADRVCAIAQDKHPLWDVEFALESADDIAAIRPNGIVLLDDELFEDSNGKIAKIVEVDGQFGNNVYRIVTWGAETP